VASLSRKCSARVRDFEKRSLQDFFGGGFTAPATHTTNDFFGASAKAAPAAPAHDGFGDFASVPAANTGFDAFGTPPSNGFGVQAAPKPAQTARGFDAFGTYIRPLSLGHVLGGCRLIL
jgi:hypothetical protein